MLQIDTIDCPKIGDKIDFYDWLYRKLLKYANVVLWMTSTLNGNK